LEAITRKNSTDSLKNGYTRNVAHIKKRAAGLKAKWWCLPLVPEEMYREKHH
jgi:hypothetical protein